MKTATVTETIAVEALRPGMFVHLGVGWMSHPFPLSSFKIASADQVRTIRSLGLKTVRWSPELSDPEADPHAEAPQAAVAEEPPPEPTPSPEETERQQRREALAAQRAASALCERQYAEAARECRQLTELASSQPEAAGTRAGALAAAITDKMLIDGDLCVRLLNDGLGDRHSAHALNVAVVSLLMGRTFGLPHTDMLDVGVGALLHDIGKVDLPERVRHRDEALTLSEQRFYEEHVAHGVTRAKRMHLTPGATLVIAEHHEMADGSGFPLGLNSDRMTLGARIVALVNRYDNLCNAPLPSRSLTPHESLSLLFAQGKNKFDTAILGAFIKMMGVYPAGSVVQLTDDRFGLVVAVNSTRPLKPRVLIYDRKVPADEALFVDLERVPNLGIRRSLKPSALSGEVREYLAPRQRLQYFFEPVADWPARG